jgi:hypothetical protein
MRSASVPMIAVWAIALAVFAGAVFVSRGLSDVRSSYWTGVVGLIAVGVALLLSWRRASDAASYTPQKRDRLQTLIAVGAVLWVLAMMFPFL